MEGDIRCYTIHLLDGKWAFIQSNHLATVSKSRIFRVISVRKSPSLCFANLHFSLGKQEEAGSSSLFRQCTLLVMYNEDKLSWEEFWEECAQLFVVFVFVLWYVDAVAVFLRRSLVAIALGFVCLVLGAMREVCTFGLWSSLWLLGRVSFLGLW